MESERRICTLCPDGELIHFKCKNHPESKYTSKNIGQTNSAGEIYFQRSIFLEYGSYCCNCDSNSLVHIHEDHKKN